MNYLQLLNSAGVFHDILVAPLLSSTCLFCSKPFKRQLTSLGMSVCWLSLGMDKRAAGEGLTDEINRGNTAEINEELH